jgi:hypothetical protein
VVVVMEEAEDSVVAAAVMEEAEDSGAAAWAVDSAAGAWAADWLENMPAAAPWEGSAAVREGSEVRVWAASAGPNHTAPALAATAVETTTLAAITMDTAALAEASSARMATSPAMTTTATTTSAITPMTAHASSIAMFTPPRAGDGVRFGSATEPPGKRPCAPILTGPRRQPTAGGSSDRNLVPRRLVSNGG